MKQTLFILFALSTFAPAAYGQPEQQDTLWHVQMEPVQIKGERVWENDTVRYHYNQTKYYITTILPYLKEAITMHEDMQQWLATEKRSRKEKKEFIELKEEQFRTKFDAEIKGLNETQGTLLVKLIARQTGENIYALLKDYKSIFSATKWLAWAKFHGFNLNRKYNPDKEPMLENIMESLDYPLPAHYYDTEMLTSN